MVVVDVPDGGPLRSPSLVRMLLIVRGEIVFETRASRWLRDLSTATRPAILGDSGPYFASMNYESWATKLRWRLSYLARVRSDRNLVDGSKSEPNDFQRFMQQSLLCSFATLFLCIFRR